MIDHCQIQDLHYLTTQRIFSASLTQLFLIDFELLITTAYMDFFPAREVSEIILNTEH
jgi:hypothetical protein